MHYLSMFLLLLKTKINAKFDLTGIDNFENSVLSYLDSKLLKELLSSIPRDTHKAFKKLRINFKNLEGRVNI